MIIANDPEVAATSTTPMNDEMLKVFAWFEEHAKAGRVIANSGRRLEPPDTARTVRMDNGKAAITDGPFAETKEAIGGYALLDMPDLEAAVELAATWPGRGVLELRPVIPPQP
jgi:hypothetical protein